MARKASRAESLSFEQTLDRLEDVVDKLETGEAGLDQSLKLYEDGVKMLDRCHGMLERAEKKIQQLVKDSEGRLKVKPFAVDTDDGEDIE